MMLEYKVATQWSHCPAFVSITIHAILSSSGEPSDMLTRTMETREDLMQDVFARVKERSKKIVRHIFIVLYNHCIQMHWQ